MANIKYRQSATPTVPTATTVKGTPLTNLEVDGNFKSLNDDIATKATPASVAAAQAAAISYTDSTALTVTADAVALAIALG